MVGTYWMESDGQRNIRNLKDIQNYVCLSLRNKNMFLKLGDGLELCVR